MPESTIGDVCLWTIKRGVRAFCEHQPKGLTMTSVAPIEGSFYVEGRKTKNGAELEIESEDPEKIERIKACLTVKGWSVREGVQLLLFPNKTAVCLSHRSGNPARSLTTAYSELSRLRAV